MLTADGSCTPARGRSRAAVTAFTRAATQGGAVRGRHRPRRHAGAGEHRRRRAGAGAARGARLLGRRCSSPSGRSLRAAGPVRQGVAHAGRLDAAGSRRRRAHGRGARRAAGRGRARRDPRPADPAAPARLPLEGVKVADFSWIGVGPITAKALADHGATVVHVESDKPGRPAAPRRSVQGRHPRHQPLPVLRRRSTRRSCRCSSTSSTPTAHDIARRLLAWCDIALDSFTAGHDGRRSASATTSPAS